MRSALIDTLCRQASLHRRTLMAYLFLLSTSMGVAATVSAIVPLRPLVSSAICSDSNAAQCANVKMAHKR